MLCLFLQFGLELIHCLHGVFCNNHKQIHKDYHGVQTQAKEHREEPEDQAEVIGPGVSGAGVGHVHQLCAQYNWGVPGPVQFWAQAVHQFSVPGPQWPAISTRRGILLKSIQWTWRITSHLILHFVLVRVFLYWNRPHASVVQHKAFIQCVTIWFVWCTLKLML